MSATMTTYRTTTGRQGFVGVCTPWAGLTMAAPRAFDGSAKAFIALDSHKNDRPGSGELSL